MQGVRSQAHPKRSHLKYNLVFGGALALVCGFAAHSTAAQLRVDLSTKEQAWASASLEDAPEGRYGWRNDNASQDIRAVQCSRIGGLPISGGTFSVPVGCGVLGWKFRLTPYPGGGTVASDQLSLFAEDPSWWIISEGGALPHRSGAETA